MHANLRHRRTEQFAGKVRETILQLQIVLASCEQEREEVGDRWWVKGGERRERERERESCLKGGGF